MKCAQKAQRIVLAGALLAVCLFGSGCASMVEGMMESAIASPLDKWDYDQKVDYYKSRGASQKKAEQAAYEDQFFEKMQDDP